MSPRPKFKWRPSLGFVLGGGLAGTLALSFVGLVLLRYLGPEIGFRNAAILLGLLILLATAVLGWLLVRLLVTPIRALERYAAQTRQDPSQAIDPPQHSGTKELFGMGQSVIDMAEHLRNREVTIRSFTDHVSHEIKTPVSAIRAAAELLTDGGTLDADDQKIVAEIEGASQQIERQLVALRDMARAREIKHVGHCDLAALEPWIIDNYPNVSIALKGSDVQIPMIENGVKIILTQLFQNACNHGAQQIVIRAMATKSGMDLHVQDDGRGISSGNSDQIFTPFFTTRRDQGGTGMGLTIIRNMLSVHGGQITLLPSDCGACFLIRFSDHYPALKTKV